MFTKTEFPKAFYYDFYTVNSTRTQGWSKSNFEINKVIYEN